MPAALIDVTEKAARKGLALLAKNGRPSGAIRVEVIPGGCSGYRWLATLGRCRAWPLAPMGRC